MSAPNVYRLIALVIVGCGESKKASREPAANDVTFKVEPSPEWTSLFNRTHGWSGGDGIFAIPFSGNIPASLCTYNFQSALCGIKCHS